MQCIVGKTRLTVFINSQLNCLYGHSGSLEPVLISGFRSVRQLRVIGSAPPSWTEQ